MKQAGLKLKLTIAFGILSLFPMILMGFVSIYLVNMTHEQDVITMERELLRQKIGEIDKFVEEVIGLFEIRVSYVEKAALIQKDQQFILEKLLQTEKSIQEASFIGLDGMELSKITRGNNDNLTLNNASSLPKFIMAQSGKRYFGEIYQTPDGPMLTIAAPVFNSLGDLIMVLSGEISLQPLRRIFNSSVLGNTGYVYIVDQNNKIFGSSNNALIGQDLAKTARLKNSAQPGSVETREGLLTKKVVAMSLPMEKLRWQVTAEWPFEDAFYIVTTIRNQLIVFSIAVMILVATMGWLVRRRILGPLATLNLGAQKIGSGNFGYKIKLDTGDEIEELGNVFNKMGSDLDRHAQELEKSHEKIEEHLQEINKLKDEFVFIAAHELRAPITVLKAYVAEIIDDQKLMKKMEKSNPYFIEIIKNIDFTKDRLISLLNDLLNVALMEAGKFKVNAKEIDFTKTFSPLLKDLERLGDKKKISLSLNIKGEIPIIKTDPDRVSELLTNLVSNAIKYNRDGGKVVVTASFADKKLFIDVMDTGIGLSDEEKSHLFEKFWRSDDARRIEGTGLGLFIVKHIIEQMGGSIACETKKDVGTTFKFQLPAV